MPGLNKKRKVVAIGDLHGDFYRLIRIMEEEGLLIPSTLAWNPANSNIDFVLVGDYIDWRGEQIEGGQKEAISGASRIIKFLIKLKKNLDNLKKVVENFESKFYGILGNHDDMMFQSFRIFEFLSNDEVKFVIENAYNYWEIRKFIGERGFTSKECQIILGFLNWFSQGGEFTMASFGGLQGWRKSMEGEVGEFIKNLDLGVVIDGKLYTHSLPDDKRFWKPLSEIFELPPEDFEDAKENIIWGRRIWGFDFKTGRAVKPFTEEEINEMLEKMKVKGAIVGHTPLKKKEPFYAYNGKIINIDLHGVTGSGCLIEEYDMGEGE